MRVAFQTKQVFPRDMIFKDRALLHYIINHDWAKVFLSKYRLSQQVLKWFWAKKLNFKNVSLLKLRWKTMIKLNMSKNQILLSNLTILMKITSRKSCVISWKMKVYLITLSQYLPVHYLEKKSSFFTSFSNSQIPTYSFNLWKWHQKQVKATIRQGIKVVVGTTLNRFSIHPSV